VQDVKRTSDRFKDMYNDRVVIRVNEQRYLLLHNRQQQCLDLTVYGGDGCESAPPTVLVKIRSALDQMVGDFGVKYRFEAHCDLRGELGWHALEDDLHSHAIGKLWLSGSVAPEPEEQAHPSESEAPTDPSMASRFQIMPMEDRKFDFFINHCQKSGQDQCKTLCLELQKVGASVWYDMQAQDLTAQGMEKGVSESRNVIIFLSDDVMGRPFCNAEQRWAKQYGCTLIGVVEKDSRHSPADFGKEKERAPIDLKHMLDDVEFLDYERRDYKARSMIEEIIRRGGCNAPEPEPEPEPEQELQEPEPEPELLAEGVPPTDLLSFLGKAHAVLADELDALGVEEVDDLKELETEEVEGLIGMLKPVQGRKLRKALAAL
jgi:hypothetical protein